MHNASYGHVVLGMWHKVPIRTGLHMGDDHLSWNEEMIGLADVKGAGRVDESPGTSGYGSLLSYGACG